MGAKENPKQGEGKESMAHLAGKYLTFSLAGEVYGLQIMKVQEIIRMMAITRVPRTPDFIRGVINLRGKVIPVVDMGLKFHLDRTQEVDRTCIVVVQLAVGAAPIVMGIIVDEVSEVLDIDAADIEPTPEFGSALDATFILGMGKLDGKVVMLLDVEQALSTDDIVTIVNASETESEEDDNEKEAQ